MRIKKVPERSNILYIDDEVSNLTNFKFVFRKHYNIHLAENVEEAFDIIQSNEVHLIIADQRMPKMTGSTFLGRMVHKHPHISRIIVTGYSDIDAIVEAINKGRVYHYVSKPWEPTEFKVIIDNALEVYWLKFHNQKLVDSLQGSNQELDTFLYRSSHDLRRPITTMLGLAEVAKLSIKEPAAEELFGKVEETASGMNMMLHKLYMVNDIRAGITEKMPVNFETIRQHLEKEFSDIIEQKQIDYQFNVEGEIVFGAPDRLVNNVLFNLVENSIIFRRPNSPFIHVNIWQTGEGLHIKVADNGEGIPEGFQEKIFDMYFVASETTQGNGLGLYVVKRTIDVLDGTIHLETKINNGSTFTIFIPNLKKPVVEKNLPE